MKEGWSKHSGRLQCVAGWLQKVKMSDIAELVRRVNAGEPGAQEALFEGAYGELRQLARSRLRDGGRNTVMDTTALVHESYLRFIRSGQLRTPDRRALGNVGVWTCCQC